MGRSGQKDWSIFFVVNAEGRTGVHGDGAEQKVEEQKELGGRVWCFYFLKRAPNFRPGLNEAGNKKSNGSWSGSQKFCLAPHRMKVQTCCFEGSSRAGSMDLEVCAAERAIYREEREEVSRAISGK